MNNLPEKWLTFSQGLRNGNHTQTLDLDDIYGRFVYEDNLIQRRSSEEYLKDLDIKFYERALLENSKCFIKRRNNFSSPKANENIKCYKCGKGCSKSQKDYKAEYKKLKAKIALLEANPSTSQTPKTFQPKNKGLVSKTFYWDEEEVSDDEKVTQVKVPMALADDELTVRKNHARNGYDQEMVPKTKDWVERLNLDNKIPNFNTGRILVPESKDVNESLKSIETSNTLEIQRF
uniref:Retrovirus-related Pol polyprotein from transposon TNT 1-94 n=1 Tax=Tanacetum cinerariifolium TaxID=118510 RepID=A0A699GWT5_TANCI|nr:hypothetical protein [Tanacetum cinerariifolium]